MGKAKQLKIMIERPDSDEIPALGKNPENDDTFKARTPQTGKFLKAVDEDTDVDPGEVKDESDGMGLHDFLGKTNRANREE